MIKYLKNSNWLRFDLCGLAAALFLWIPCVCGSNIADLFKAADDSGYVIGASGKPELFAAVKSSGQQKNMKILNGKGVCNALWYGGIPRLLIKLTVNGAFAADWIDGSGNTKRIYVCDPGDIFLPLTFINDGSAFYAFSNRQSEFVRLVKISCADGQERIIHTDPEKKVDAAGVLCSGKINVKLHGVYYVDDGIRYYFFDEEFATMHKLLVAKLPVGDILWDSGSDNGRQWIIKLLRDSMPAAYYYFNFDTGELRLLPDKGSALIKAGQSASVQPISYKSRDGTVLHGYLTIPAGSNGRQLPVVVFVHGGPASRVFRWFDPRVQALAAGGYAVFQPNYRGSRGFGKHYMTAGWKTWGTGTLQNDITDGVRHLINNGVAHPGKIAIMGGSFGGYCALAGLAFTPELYACGIDIFGMSDLVCYLREIQDEQKPLQPLDQVMCGDINNPSDLSRLKSQSPINFADKIRAPLFIYHGAKDTLINPSHSERMVQLLRSRNAEIEYYLNPNEEHGFSTLDAETKMYYAILHFLDKYIMLTGIRLKRMSHENQKFMYASVPFNFFTASARLGCPQVVVALPNDVKNRIPNYELFINEDNRN